jgi:hypothetical protein
MDPLAVFLLSVSLFLNVINAVNIRKIDHDGVLKDAPSESALCRESKYACENESGGE